MAKKGKRTRKSTTKKGRICYTPCRRGGKGKNAGKFARC